MSAETQFIDAIKSGNLVLVGELIHQTPELLQVRYQGYLTPILLAMYYDQPEIARFLADLGAAFDLFTAAAIGKPQDMADLLDRKPEGVNAFAQDGFQPLGLAAYFGNIEAVRLLLENGARVNDPSKNEMHVTPLHSAVAHRQLQIARLLLEHGADVNIRQAGDYTPLHGAAQNGQHQMVELLLKYGAEIGARTTDGVTPLDMAKNSGSQECVALLQVTRTNS